MNDTLKRFNRVRQSGDGNFMAALASVHADAGVAALFQITPTTQFAEALMELKREGKTEMELLLMNGEDDAYTACHTASQCGSSVVTGSCSQGLLFAAQVIKSFAGSRCPVVNYSAMRATSAPISIHAEHDDILFFRDSGGLIWIAKTPQEVYDLMLLAFKVGEHLKVQLPVNVGCDGFDVSHTVTINSVLSEEAVGEFRKWLGEYVRPNSLLSEKFVSLGGLALPQHHMDIVYSQLMAMENALPVMEESFAEYRKLFGNVPDLVEGYRMEDAKHALISMGSAFGTTKEAVDIVREKHGIKIGTLSVMSYRPFPVIRLWRELRKMDSVAVLDRAPTFGTVNAPLGSDVSGIFQNHFVRPKIMNCVYGIGGRTMTVEHVIEQIILPLANAEETWISNTRPTWIGVNGGK